MTMYLFLAALAFIGLIDLRADPVVARESPFVLPAANVETSAPDADERCRTAPGTELISRDDISNAGVVRLGDIFRLSHRWYAHTIDGYTWSAQVSGLSAASNPRWTVLIDGNPVELGLFGIQNLDVIPIHVDEIECIEMTARPTVAAGALRQFGTIHIRSRTAAQGMTLGASVAAGNEVNDPGPFLYTPLRSPNIDRIGPIGAAEIDVAVAGLSARLSGKLDEFHVTDMQVDERAKQLFDIDTKPRITLQAASLTAAFDSRWGRQNVLAGRSETGDLIFFDTFGLEIPATRHFEYLGGAGRIMLGTAELRYRGSYLSHDLVHRQNVENLTLDFRKQVISAGLETRIHSGPVRLAGGGSFDLMDALSTRSIMDTRTIQTKVFGEISGSYRERVHGMIHASWIQVEETPTFAFYQSVYVSPWEGHWMGLTSSLARRTLAMDESLWRWTRLGYTLPQRPAIDDEPPAADIRNITFEPEPRLGTVDLEFGGLIATKFSYLVTGYYRRATSEYLPLHEIGYSAESTGLLTNTSVQGYLSSGFLGLSFSLGHRLIRTLSQRFTYVAEGITSGDKALEDIHAHIPAQRLSYSLTFSPVDRFSLFARARYHVGTVWQEYHAVAAASGGFYPAELSDAFIIDIAATKRLWKDHLLANVSIRNVLNEPYRTHPGGAIIDMAFHFSVRASFNSATGF
jgi:hypothetical protein